MGNSFRDAPSRKNRRRTDRKAYIYGFFTLVGIVGIAVCGTMLFQAWEYMEWGRVLVYGALSLFSGELAGWFGYRLLRAWKSAENT